MNKVIKVMSISFITNILLALTKIIVGFIGKSSALITDGIHSFSDLITDIIAILGNGMSNKPADYKHPYGHGKLEYLTSLIIGFAILILGLGIIYEMINREIYIPSFMVIVVSVITIITKMLLSRYVIRKGNEYNNNILIASGKESSTDVISSIVVLLSVMLMQLSEINKIFLYADKVASMIVGMFIVKVGFDILKDNISTILGEQETNLEYINKIKEIILKEEKIKAVDSLVMLKYGPYYKLIGEVSMDSSLSLIDAHNAIDNIEKTIKKKDHKIAYITFHMCPYIEDNNNLS
jgi:cation diffusion facilitator family transporter